MLSRVLAFGFLWSRAKTMSEEGWILDVFSLEIRQNHVQKVCFCTERPLDTNFVHFGGPRSSLEGILEASGGGWLNQARPGQG